MPAADTQWRPGQSGCPEKILRPGHRWRWPPGVSGNPQGVTKTQQRFRELYVLALAGGSDEELEARAQELADIAWKAARKGESWAYQEIRGQLAPLIAAAQIRLVHEANDDGIDFGQLTDGEFAELGRLLEKAAGGGPKLLEGGTVPAEPSGILEGGLAPD